MTALNRRRFLQILTGVALAPTVTYFLPPIKGWHKHKTGLWINGTKMYYGDTELTRYQAEILDMIVRRYPFAMSHGVESKIYFNGAKFSVITPGMLKTNSDGSSSFTTIKDEFTI